VIVGNKVGAGRGPDRSWIITDHPDTVRQQVREALADLGTEASELTYLRLGGDGPAPEVARLTGLVDESKAVIDQPYQSTLRPVAELHR